MDSLVHACGTCRCSHMAKECGTLRTCTWMPWRPCGHHRFAAARARGWQMRSAHSSGACISALLRTGRLSSKRPLGMAMHLLASEIGAGYEGYPPREDGPPQSGRLHPLARPRPQRANPGWDWPGSKGRVRAQGPCWRPSCPNCKDCNAGAACPIHLRLQEVHGANRT